MGIPIDAQDNVLEQDRNVMGERYRIAIVTSLHPDFDVRVWKYARTVAKIGHSVVLICPWAVPNGEIREGVRFAPFTPAMRRAHRYKTPFRVFWRLLPLLPELDIIHFQNLDLLPWMTVLSVFKHVIYDVHENYPEEIMAKKWIPRPLRRGLAFIVRWGQLACANIIRNVVLVAKSQESDIYGPRLRKAYVMNYASIELLDKVNHDYSSRAASVILTGSQYVDNGSLLYLEIASLVHQRRKDVVFYGVDRFSGTLEFRPQVLKHVKDLGLDAVYRLLPNVKAHELMSHLNKATVAVAVDLRVPRRIRAVPTKLFEYMAAGLPIVASDLPCQTEVVGGNNAGLLAKPEEPETFASAILQLLEDRELAARLGENGRRAFLEHYSWESQEIVIDDYYRSIMQPSIVSN
jgi:glycosyltransferase involved in cell wall biosynthesis